MNIMQVMALLGQGGGRAARVGGPLASGGGMQKGGPLAVSPGIMNGTSAQQAPQPLERIDPDTAFAAAPSMAPAATPALAPPAAPPGMGAAPPSDSDRAGVSMMPLLGPLAGSSVAVPPSGPAKRGGVFGRIGDFVGSDEGKGALLRAGAAMLSGGSVGDGISAGAQFVDGRRKERMDQQVQEREFGQRDRSLDISQQSTDQTGLYQAGQLQNAATRANIDMAELEVRAKNEAARLQLDWTKLSQADRQFLITAQIRAAEEEGRNQRHSSPSGSTVYASDSATARTDKTIDAADRRAGAGNLGEIVTTSGEVKPVEGGWFSSAKPGKPATKTSIKVQALPASQAGLVPGGVYATAQGNARWNGVAFEAIE